MFLEGERTLNSSYFAQAVFLHSDQFVEALVIAGSVIGTELIGIPHWPTLG